MILIFLNKCINNSGIFIILPGTISKHHVPEFQISNSSSFHPNKPFLPVSILTLFQSEAEKDRNSSTPSLSAEALTDMGAASPLDCEIATRVLAWTTPFLWLSARTHTHARVCVHTRVFLQAVVILEAWLYVLNWSIIFNLLAGFCCISPQPQSKQWMAGHTAPLYK